MSSLAIESRDPPNNPVDIVEQLAADHDWNFQRRSEDELAAEIPGQWCSYRLWFCWHPEIGVFHLTCALDLEVPERRLPAVYRLLALANERLWLGHFEMWSEEGVPTFRHGVLFRDGMSATGELVEELVEIAVNECDRFYPAFEFVIARGKRPEEALAASLLETEGEA
ncbi:hypothetical protein HRbin40_02632 [bacterium HR40]|nr:hypothetical protein HRbin40_02632 [bacterium HR40]